MGSNIQEKFEAAIKLIQSMPKNGSFQPSTELQLRFYAFFKQGTDGPCKVSKPSIWNVIAKTKWDAWNKLGNMPKEEAMQRYIDELKKIVETMAFTEDVADFLDALGPFYEVVYDTGSPVKLKNLEDALAARRTSEDKEVDSGYGTEMDKATPEPVPEPIVEHNVEEPEEASMTRGKSFGSSFGSSMSMYDDFKSIAGSTGSRYGSVGFLGSAKDDISDDEFADADSESGRPRYSPEQRCNCQAVTTELKSVEDELKGTLQRLRRDVEEVKVRVATVEAVGMRERVFREDGSQAAWWPLTDISAGTVAFVITWPFVAHLLMSWFMRRR